jgi:hypothetical protein
MNNIQLSISATCSLSFWLCLVFEVQPKVDELQITSRSAADKARVSDRINTCTVEPDPGPVLCFVITQLAQLPHTLTHTHIHTLSNCVQAFSSDDNLNQLTTDM